MNNINFNPIYVWAQAKDNSASDDFFEINLKKTCRVEDLNKIQEKVFEMNNVVRNSLLPKNKRVSEAITYFTKNIDSLQSVSLCPKNKRVVISFNTDDFDIDKRESNIDVFLDLTNVNSKNVKDYIVFFDKGFRNFCQMTNRHPKDLGTISNPKFEYILENWTSSFSNELKNLISNRPVLVITAVVIILFIVLKLIF